MAWTVILEDENKEALSSLGSEFALGILNDLARFKLLQYLDPYIDATFNRLQMDDLILDLKILQELDKNPLIDEILLLVARCKTDAYTYICFYGD
jgi:hypothetical protein